MNYYYKHNNGVPRSFGTPSERAAEIVQIMAEDKKPSEDVLDQPDTISLSELSRMERARI